MNLRHSWFGKWLGTPDQAEMQALLDATPFRQFSYKGYCPCCEQAVAFRVLGPYLRDTLLCSSCGSIPRERAMTAVFRQVVGSLECKLLHESSPVPRGFSAYLQRHYGAAYLGSQYWPGQAPGQLHQGFRNENLEALGFADNSVSVHVSQDVFEHLFDPLQAARELYRTLSPGGFHIFTTPLAARSGPTRQRARLQDGKVVHLEFPAEYHGDATSDQGALVTYHYGQDLPAWIDSHTGFRTKIFSFIDVHQGIMADLNEVIVSRKPE